MNDPYDLILDEGIDEVYRLMVPCRNCGELRPRGDASMGADGTCHLCRANPNARRRDTRDILELWDEMDEGVLDADDEDAADDRDGGGDDS